MKNNRHGRASTLDGSRALSRRGALKGAGVLAGAAAAASLPGWTAFAQSGSDAPIRLGFQVHRTGIGAAYGRWYERTSQAAVKYINDNGGIAGRPVELVIEDDGTDPKRGVRISGMRGRGIDAGLAPVALAIRAMRSFSSRSI